jgi:uncharacterized protein YbbK (DUF523 family)
LESKAPFVGAFLLAKNSDSIYFGVMRKAVLVSRCLLGERCRWDANILEDSRLEESKSYRLITICPEMDGGLPCPRSPSEIDGGDGFDVLDGKSSVVDTEGRDVTDNYLKGAQLALNKAFDEGANLAYLKERSPSCGVRTIYQDGKLVSGMGVAAALLSRHGLKLVSVE